ncbi:MAG: 23S rRNA (pseudouridine(1915)-N(3))-methyltransferase RlmH [Minwuia sp.]|uniref:23S rRNA (pseudouridine(1915)-N(3))-methyltransferase RlmH n=1 Tax=Minwuia sp. TaxID=2493630 RepID=UPI003A8945FD
MIRASILSIGRFGRGPERDLYEHYVRRLNWPCDLVELEDRRGGSDAERNARENALLRERLTGSDAVIALDESGREIDSRAFAALLQDFADQGRRNVAFLIGGADGLEAETRARADRIVSFGRLTWPHLLVRALLAEQLYRASAILSGHPYHRD